jgi:hypothetical protein
MFGTRGIKGSADIALNIPDLSSNESLGNAWEVDTMVDSLWLVVVVEVVVVVVADEDTKGAFVSAGDGEAG